MKALLVLVTAVFLGTPAQAARATNTSVEGIVQSQGNSPALRLLHSPNVLRLVTEDQAIKRDIMKLQPGDYLAAYGEVSADQRTFKVLAIETVGLKSLLGRWQTRDGEVFEFRDFNSLLHYAGRFLVRSSQPITRHLSYYLAPDSVVNRWAIFLADKTTVLIGSIEFGSRSVVLTLLDPNNGKVFDRIELRPITN